MQAVKNISRNGRTVMVTIHQPSIEIFETFDALVLLQAGGRVMTFPPCTTQILFTCLLCWICSEAQDYLVVPCLQSFRVFPPHFILL